MMGQLETLVFLVSFAKTFWMLKVMTNPGIQTFFSKQLY